MAASAVFAHPMWLWREGTLKDCVEAQEAPIQRLVKLESQMLRLVQIKHSHGVVVILLENLCKLLTPFHVGIFFFKRGTPRARRNADRRRTPRPPSSCNRPRSE